MSNYTESEQAAYDKGVSDERSRVKSICSGWEIDACAGLTDAEWDTIRHFERALFKDMQPLDPLTQAHIDKNFRDLLD